MQKPIITGEWRNLVMLNYKVDPSILKDHIPTGTELNLFNGDCYVSLAAFQFLNFNIHGIPVPFHQDFIEINFRFYVRQSDDENKYGVVFIKEIVPKPFVALPANLVYQEHYAVMPITLNHQIGEEHQEIDFYWKSSRWNSLQIKAEAKSVKIDSNSSERFFMEQPWGFTKVNDQKTYIYHVTHPSWLLFPITHHSITVDFGELFGSEFEFLSNEKPSSLLMANGSGFGIYLRKKLRSHTSLVH